MDYHSRQKMKFLLACATTIIQLALQIWYDLQDSTNIRRISKKRKLDSFIPSHSTNPEDENMDMETFLITSGQENLVLETDFSISQWRGRIQGEWYVKPRSLHWWNHYIFEVKCDDQRFRNIFRLPYELFESLCESLHEDLSQGDIPFSFVTSIKSRVFPVEKQVAIAVLRLSSGMTMINISELFGCGKSTIVRTVNKFINAMQHRFHRNIQWPNNQLDLEILKEGFRQRQGFPNCCGVIDVTHIQFRLPANECSADWYDRDHNYSMSLQAIVDSNMHFIDVFTGWPGSVNDARLLRNSSFFKLCEGGQRLNGHSVSIGSSNMREYIIGDGGYPLSPWLITPFSGSLTNSQRKYNFKLSSTRIVVECAFGRLKNTWRILQSRICQPNLQMLPKTILVCCILHNMMLALVEDESNGIEVVDNANYVHTNELGVDPVATLSREALMDFVNGDDNLICVRYKSENCSFVFLLPIF
ncbi:hypothetical protein KI387_041543 [Taxus chinensis]|uniref:DDE Tnp4 domain-containing protein n=1 Tax=Taxus chinensis TaxID=29808 RepID=A0AA38CBM4_TAXCH|nr:hypothetical protein KI387_041543 [Taxus chinensis]